MKIRLEASNSTATPVNRPWREPCSAPIPRSRVFWDCAVDAAFKAIDEILANDPPLSVKPGPDKNSSQPCAWGRVALQRDCQYGKRTKNTQSNSKYLK